MRRILYLTLLFSLLNAESIIDENIITGSAGGKKIIEENPVAGYDPNANRETYRKEAIYNFVLYNDSKRVPGMAMGKANLVNVVNTNTTTPNASKITDNKTITVAGFCLIKEDIFLEKQHGALNVNCETNIGMITMFANLKSVNQLNSLVVDPIWIDYRGGRHKVVDSIVTNEAQTSYNVATYVNDRKIAEIGWSTMAVASEEGKTFSNAYLRALEESRKKQEVAYVDVAVNANESYRQAVQNTNVDPPRASDYLIGAGINILASAVKTTAEIFKRDLPYLYEVVGGTKIYVDMQVLVKGEKIR